MWYFGYRLLGAITCLAISYLAIVDTVAASPYDGFIRATAQHYGLEPALVKAVIKCESNFDPQAISPRGAQGLMQLMPKTQTSLGISNAFNPRQNIDAGTRYLALLRETFGAQVPLLLAAYNAGPQAIIDAGYTVPDFAETERFIVCVETAQQRYQLEGFNAFTVGTPMHDEPAEVPPRLIVSPLRLPSTAGVVGQRLRLDVEAWNAGPDTAHGVVSLLYPDTVFSHLALQTTPAATTVHLPDPQGAMPSPSSEPSAAYQLLQGNWQTWQPQQRRTAALVLIPQRAQDIALQLSVLLYDKSRTQVNSRWSTVVHIKVNPQ